MEAVDGAEMAEESVEDVWLYMRGNVGHFN